MYNTLGKNNVKYVSTDSVGRTFKTFYNFIEKNYIGDIDEDEMLESAIKGYVAGLNDEYSEYITKEEMKEYMQDATGKYVGIGVYIANNTKTNQIVVLTPIKGSPAEEAGIRFAAVFWHRKNSALYKKIPQDAAGDDSLRPVRHAGGY